MFHLKFKNDEESFFWKMENVKNGNPTHSTQFLKFASKSSSRRENVDCKKYLHKRFYIRNIMHRQFLAKVQRTESERVTIYWYTWNQACNKRGGRGPPRFWQIRRRCRAAAARRITTCPPGFLTLCASLLSIWMGQIQSDLIFTFVNYGLTRL